MAGTRQSGRKPTPTELRVLRGNPGHRNLDERAHEVKPEPPSTLEPPAWLSAAARAEWDDKAAMLQRLGLITEADVDAFAVYCDTFARWKEAAAKLSEQGVVVMSKRLGLPIVSPWFGIANKLQMQAAKLLIEFGLTPSSRTRVHATPKKMSTTDTTRKDRFFGTGRK